MESATGATPTVETADHPHAAPEQTWKMMSKMIPPRPTVIVTTVTQWN
jgi:hypothetical protein